MTPGQALEAENEARREFCAAMQNIFRSTSGAVLRRNIDAILATAPCYDAAGRFRGVEETHVHIGRQLGLRELIEAAEEAEARNE